MGEIDRGSSWTVIVHCGAGWHKPEKRVIYQESMIRACYEAGKMLKENKSPTIPSTVSLLATAEALHVLEDDPSTNAGIGSALNIEGNVEMDCGIMDGDSGGYGAVGAISNVLNPSDVCKHILTHSISLLPLGRIPPIFLVGIGANQYAIKHNLGETFDQESSPVMTETSKKIFRNHSNQLREHEAKCSKRDQTKDTEELPPAKKQKNETTESEKLQFLNHETIGCVCIDSQNNIASGTSSGGISLKQAGRVGQAAIYGCGCWADDTVGISCSGSGESLTKYLMAYECARNISQSDDPALALTYVLKEYSQKVNPLKKTCKMKKSNEKQVGVIALSTSFENEKLEFTELLWAHTSPSFGIAYYSNHCKEPTVLFSESNHSNSDSIAIGGKIFIHRSSPRE